MLKRKLIHLITVFVVLGITSLCHAIEMYPTANGNKATVVMIADCQQMSACMGNFTVNFGDGRSTVNSPTFSITPGKKQSWTSIHTYAQDGTYTLQGGWTIITSPPVNPPTVTKSISIKTTIAPIVTEMTLTPAELEDATVAEEYKVRFTLGNGTPPYSYRLQSGSFPPGLTLNRSGILSGIPTRLGRYRFTIKFGDSRGKVLTQQYEMIVGSGEAEISVTPTKQNASKQGNVPQKITWEYDGTAVQDTLRSSRGQFFVGGALTGSINRSQTLSVRNGKARSIESVIVPPSVIRRAEQMRTNKISYSRTFTSPSMTGKASTYFILGSRSGDLKITRMRVYFDNNRPRKLVSRSSKDISASVQIQYAGTGLLKGFWEVDGRILQRVQKHIRFGKSIILETPSVPPLPTYAEGSHRLRFVISSPNQNIQFPIAFYDVVENKKSRRSFVVLLTPIDKEQIQLSEFQFSWRQQEGATNYLISFFDAASDSDEPMFSAYTQKKIYQLPAKVIEKHFQSEKGFKWLVLGLDSDGNITSKSKAQSFSILLNE